MLAGKNGREYLVCHVEERPEHKKLPIEKVQEFAQLSVDKVFFWIFSVFNAHFLVSNVHDLINSVHNYS